MAWRIGQPPEDGHEDTVLDRDGYGDEYKRRLRALAYAFLDGPLQEAVAMALRFTLTVPGVDTAIVGTTRPGRWQQNADLLKAGPLSERDYGAIRRRWREAASDDWGGQE